jgi:hypothetical protein
MAAVSRDVHHDGSTSGVSMPTAVALVFVLLIVVAYLAAKSQGALDPMRGAIHERSTRRRGAGLEPRELNSIIITKYKAAHQAISVKGPPLLAVVEEEDAQAPAPTEHTASTAKEKRSGRQWIITRLRNALQVLSKFAFCVRYMRERPPQSCSICTEDFRVGDDVRRLLCTHIFHPRCIDPWLRGFAVTCPLWQVNPFLLIVSSAMVWANKRYLCLPSRIDVTAESAALRLSKPRAAVARLCHYVTR